MDKYLSSHFMQSQLSPQILCVKLNPSHFMQSQLSPQLVFGKQDHTFFFINIHIVCQCLN